MPDISFLNQQIAADPHLSVWVSASAGTGKTTVLVNRLLRLFLNDIEPSKILCLTYTNAGAFEMQDRIYKRAKQWATMPDESLRKDLHSLFDNSNDFITEKEKDFEHIFIKARKLFSKLLDNAVPLKIYTIHAFCQAVLKRFPIEAGISPHFKIIDDIEKTILLNEAYKQLVSNIKYDKSDISPDIFSSFNYLMNLVSQNDFDKIKNEIITSRENFSELLKTYHNKENISLKLREIIFQGFDTIIDDFIKNDKLYIENVLNHIPNNFIENLEGFLRLNTQYSTNSKRYDKLNNIIRFRSPDLQDDVEERFNLYKSVFISSKNTLYETLFVKKVIDTNKTFYQDVLNEGKRIENAVRFLNCSKIYMATLSIIDIGLALNHIYDNLKKKKGVMDFTDLITSVKKLFSIPNVSEWILYKLDGGISHILIDEAQDTSPLQWDIVDNLTQEFFTTGRTEKDIKTLFSVGDVKQSIFSFQGANIKLFKKYKDEFKKKIETNNYKFYDLPLNVSFRSCKNILNTVDDVVKNLSGVRIGDEEIKHIHNRTDSNGIVEVLPLIKATEKDEDEIFKTPIKHIYNFNPDMEQANVLAKKIRYLLDNEYISDGEINGEKYIRKIQPKDIMILVRKRNYMDSAITALVNNNIPVSGQDKLSLSDNIVVEDLISLLKFVLFNYDDLSLAEVLKSPLYNLDDDDLFTLCYNRGDKTLFERLSEEIKYREIFEDLSSLIKLSKTAFPFEFFDFVLKVQNKRENFINRFGYEIEEVLNAFLSQCLNYDNTQMGKSLSDFYEWFSLSEVVIKRDMEHTNNTVRILTVHGSKGLEAPIVFLYNTNVPDRCVSEKILWFKNFPMYKIANMDTINENFAQIVNDYKKESSDEEYRLLYVAMTRARDRLYVMGVEKNIKQNTWYSCIKQSLEENKDASFVKDEVLANFNREYIDDMVLRLGKNESGKIANETNDEKPHIISMPKYLEEKMELPSFEYKKDIKPKSPLTYLSDDNKSLLRGSIIHKLLENISKYANVKHDINLKEIIQKYFEKNIIDDHDFITEKILQLYNDNKYNFIFGNNSLSETEIMLSQNKDAKILRVDKLVILENDIWIIDYKTDKDTSEIPSQYKKQLQEYKNAVSKIYPNKNIHTAILWITDLKFQEF